MGSPFELLRTCPPLGTGESRVILASACARMLAYAPSSQAMPRIRLPFGAFVARSAMLLSAWAATARAWVSRSAPREAFGQCPRATAPRPAREIRRDTRQAPSRCDSAARNQRLAVRS